MQAASDVTGDGNDALLADLDRLRGLREMIRNAEFGWCRYGGVLIGQCSYVQARVEQFNEELRDRQRSTLPTVSEREQVAARLAEQATRLRTSVSEIQQRLDAMNRRKNDLLEQRRSVNDQIRRIPSMLAEIQDWTGILEGKKANTALQRLDQEEANVEAEIETTRSTLDQLIADQAQRATLFEGRFDSIVRQTLTDQFKGAIEIVEDGVNFGIKRGESLYGEAYETLAVLLGDIALLFESNALHAHHPGILIHDSPREADLNLQIYQRLLDVADANMQQSAQGVDIPYQYIVTTTTLPSARLQNSSVTKLKLSSGEGSLFGRQLEAPIPALPLFALFDREIDA